MPLLFERASHRRIKSNRTSNFRRQIFRGFLQLALIAFLLFIVWHGTRLEALTIQSITIEGGETVSHEDVRSVVDTELQGSYFLVVPKRFTFMYPHDRIVEVLENIPRIYDVSVIRRSRTALGVTFKEHIPYALWCGNEEEPCFFMNKSGNVFAEAPLLHGGALVRHSREGLEKVAEGHVLDEDLLLQLDEFLTRADRELGLRFSSIFHKANGDIEMQVNGGGMILLASGDDITAAFENLKSVLSSDEFKHLRPGNFRYIDVRFGNKVFVNEEAATSTEKLPE